MSGEGTVEFQNVRFDINELAHRMESSAGKLRELEGLIEGFLEANGIQVEGKKSTKSLVKMLMRIAETALVKGLYDPKKKKEGG